MIRRRVLVSGHVQGVGFRASTVHAARAYAELRGFVRNLDDGRVEALFEGPESDVLAMVAWCRQGPRQAKVTELEVFDEPSAGGLPEFSVHR